MICGYTDRLSTRRGESLDVFVSCDNSSFEARLVRLLGGATDNGAEVPRTQAHPSTVDGRHPGVAQRVHPGSYVVSESFEWSLGPAFTVSAWIAPTLLGGNRRQCVFAMVVAERTVIELSVVNDKLAVFAGHSAAPAAVGPGPLRRWEWTFVELHVSADGVLQLSQHEAELGIAQSRSGLADLRLLLGNPAVVLRLGSAAVSGASVHPFNGKIARPLVWSVRDTIAWDLARDLHSIHLASIGTLMIAARTVNAPTRAVTGPAWDGSLMRAQDAAEQYDAIHLHEDDLDDAGWVPDFSIEIDSSFSSGVYAIHVQSDSGADYLPFVVTDRPEERSADVVLVLPTWTYIAYANWRTYADDPRGRATYYGEYRAPTATDLLLQARPEFGLCFYDTHADGTPVQYSSLRRPILNMRPLYRAAHANGYRHLSSDLQLIGWLEESGVSYAVTTDGDLDELGAFALSGYRVVLTGSHPEYASHRMLDAYKEYAEAGGRLMYLGGNGFYWVTSALPEQPHVLEMRRGHNGIRRIDTPAGEEYHSSTGELGGLWRYRARSPHRLVGVGLVAQGFDRGSGYRRSSSAGANEFEWAFAGVVGEEFGTGLGPLGGAAGDEIDCVDFAHGSPEGTVVIASSTGHSDRYLLAIEDIPHLLPNQSYGGVDNPKIRSDIAFVPVAGEYRIFSVGSIAWINALAATPDNAIATITGNVLRRFLASSRLENTAS